MAQVLPVFHESSSFLPKKSKKMLLQLEKVGSKLA